MNKEIGDTFGAHIGMSRKEIWNLRHGRITLDKFKSLEGKDAAYFASISNRNSLWPSPSFDNYKEMKAEEYMRALAQDMLEYTIRELIPAKIQKNADAENYVKAALCFREAAQNLKSVFQNKDVDENYIIAVCTTILKTFRDQVNNDLVDKIPSSVLDRNIIRKLEMMPRRFKQLFHNALVSDIREWNNPVIFSPQVFIDWINREDKCEIGLYKDALSSCFWKKEQILIKQMGFDTLEEFRTYIEEKDSERKKKRKESVRTKERGNEPRRPVLSGQNDAEFQRNGGPIHHIKLDPDDFRKQFDFRGGEFGSWVSQKERAQNLVMAGNALADLAWALNIDEKDIGGGKLGFAFGARGMGGKRRVAAHYEPILNVINLTREHGAGNIAHEWGHYFDDKILAPMNLHSENMRWLFWREPVSEQEIFAEWKRRLPSKTMDRDLPSWHSNPEKLKEQLDKCKNIDEFTSCVKKVITEHIAPKHLKQARLWDKWIHRQSKTEIDRVATSFLLNAQTVDGKKKYWSLPTELFARVFEKYVQMKLEEKGAENKYLVSLYRSEIDLYPNECEMKFFVPKIDELMEISFGQKPVENTSPDLK